MRTILSSFSLVLALAACASAPRPQPAPTSPHPDVTVTSPAPAPTPEPEARPALAITPPSGWERKAEIEVEGFEIALVNTEVGGVVTIDLLPAGTLLVENAEALAASCEGTGQCTPSPIETGVHDGIPFAGFKMAMTTEHGVHYGALLLRGLPGSSYVVLLTGQWSIEHTPVLLSEFQSIASAVHIEGTPAPSADPDDWFAEDSEGPGDVIRLIPME
jgi:hypothetical protein